MSTAGIDTLDLAFTMIAPFLVIIVASLLTKPNSKEQLDRLYVRLKTPVISDHDTDAAEVARGYADPTRFDHCKLFPGTNFEFQRPNFVDWFGFLACFAIIGLVFLVAGIGT